MTIDEINNLISDLKYDIESLKSDMYSGMDEDEVDCAIDKIETINNNFEILSDNFNDFMLDLKSLIEK